MRVKLAKRTHQQIALRAVVDAAQLQLLVVKLHGQRLRVVGACVLEVTPFEALVPLRFEVLGYIQVAAFVLERFDGLERLVGGFVVLARLVEFCHEQGHLVELADEFFGRLLADHRHGRREVGGGRAVGIGGSGCEVEVGGALDHGFEIQVFEAAGRGPRGKSGVGHGNLDVVWVCGKESWSGEIYSTKSSRSAHGIRWWGSEWWGNGASVASVAVKSVQGASDVIDFDLCCSGPAATPEGFTRSQFLFNTMPPRIPPLRLRAQPWTCTSCRTRPHRRLNSTAPLPTAEEPALPPTAPKPQINLKSIRASPELHAQNCINRNYASLSTYPSRIVALHNDLTTMQKSLRTERERHNTLSSLLRESTPETRPTLLAEAKTLSTTIATVEARERAIDAELKSLGAALPALSHPAAPVGAEPKLLEYINAPDSPPTASKSHLQIGQELKLLDFASAGTVAGWGWYYLLNEAVLLEQALVNYSLSLARSAGFTLVTPPNLVYSHIASACGFRPRDHHGEQQSYPTNDGKHVLAGTAEIPLAGMNANQTLAAAKLPLRTAGVGRAYRAEAGARGLDSKGLYRVHEFTKVEMFCWAAAPAADATATAPATQFTGAQDAEVVFAQMLDLQKRFVTSLGLYARVVEMPTGDLGASAMRKIDIEAWMPSRAAKDPWGEISSLSNCGDYQTRRLNTRVKGGDGKVSFPWTLNGTACAVPRVLIAILENGWSEERQGVVVPEVLRGWMGGLEFIGKKK